MARIFQPHEYQRKAIRFALDTPKCMLALDMGLGKTSITLAAISRLFDEFSVSRVLIIAPLYVASDTWVRENSKWIFESSCKPTIAVAVGSAAARRRAIESSADIVTINRENTAWLVEEYGKHWPFDMVVIDESSSFKAYNSKRFKALRRVLGSLCRVVELTGTPRPRSVEDLWSQIFLLDQGQRLGRSMTVFRESFERPGRHNGYTIYEWLPRSGMEEEIYERISDIVMSMKADDWISVPEVTVVDHHVNLSEKEQKIYKQMCKDQIVTMERRVHRDPIPEDSWLVQRAETDEVSREVLDDVFPMQFDGNRYIVESSDVVAVNAGVLAGKLLQMANGAVYDDEGKVVEYHDAKLKCLEEILESTDEPIMIFYWFKHDRDRLRRYFAKMDPQEINGPDDIARWNNGGTRILLAHPASMGHGLNLQDGGHIIVWFGMTWSLELYQQANARLHRQGQKNAVQIHRILCDGTVDLDVVKALDKKDAGQADMLAAVKEGIFRGAKDDED